MTIFQPLLLTRELLQKQDVVVINANHSIYNAEFIVRNCRIVVYTRNLSNYNKKDLYKIVKLGLGRGFYTDIYSNG